MNVELLLLNLAKDTSPFDYYSMVTQILGSDDLTVIPAHFFLMKKIDVLRTINDETNSFDEIEALVLKTMTKKEYCEMVPRKEDCNVNKASIQHVLLQPCNADKILAIHKKFSELSMIPSVPCINITPPIDDLNNDSGFKFARKLFKIGELVSVIFGYLDKHSFEKCITVCQQWLYDGYHVSNIKYIDLSPHPRELPSKLCDDLLTHDSTNKIYNYKDKGRILMAKYNLNKIQKYCQRVLIKEKSISLWLREKKKNNKQRYLMSMNLLMEMTNQWQFENMKHVTISILNSQNEQNNQNESEKSDWYEWMSSWIKKHDKKVAGIEIKCEQFKEDRNDLVDCQRLMNKYDKKLECNATPEKEKQVKLFGINDNCNKDVKILFTPPKLCLGCRITKEECDKWLSKDLNYGEKSRELVLVINKIYQWYENGNIDLSLMFEIYHNNSTSIEHFKNQKCVQLIFKVLKQVFKFENDKLYPFDDQLQEKVADLPQTVAIINGRVSMTLFKRRPTSKLCIDLNRQTKN